MSREDQVALLKKLCPSAAEATEGGVTFLHLGQISLPNGCNPRLVEALLCPVARDGYQSRLFLSEKVAHTGKGQNWNGNAYILGRTWWAVSWHTRQGIPFHEMVLGHLEAFRN